MKIVDYQAKIAASRKAIPILRRNHKSTDRIIHKISNYRTMQLKQEIRQEELAARAARKAASP